jgi:hypothetical protein
MKTIFFKHLMRSFRNFFKARARGVRPVWMKEVRTNLKFVKRSLPKHAFKVVFVLAFFANCGCQKLTRTAKMSSFLVNFYENCLNQREHRIDRVVVIKGIHHYLILNFINSFIYIISTVLKFTSQSD